MAKEFNEMTPAEAIAMLYDLTGQIPLRRDQMRSVDEAFAVIDRALKMGPGGKVEKPVGGEVATGS
jgi:hypothetical protein